MTKVLNSVNAREHLFVFVEISNTEEEEESSLEVLSEARRLADKCNMTVCGFLIGEDIPDVNSVLAEYGVDKILMLSDPILKEYITELYCYGFEQVVRQSDPSLIMFAATSTGRDLAPRLAARLDVPIVSECRVFELDEKKQLMMTRAIYGGRLYETYMVDPSKRPQVCTVVPGVLGMRKAGRKRSPETETFNDISLENARHSVRVLGRSRIERTQLDIRESPVVISIGGGFDGRNAMQDIEKLADLLEANIAGSRVAVDHGWIPYDRQIGQTGKSISPKLLICCGISGASQFTMGMQDSKFIISINIDPYAPIFNVSDISAVGDLNEIVPKLVDKLDKSKEQAAARVEKYGQI